MSRRALGETHKKRRNEQGLLGCRSVSDETALKKYGELAIPAIEAGGGKALIRTADALEPREAGLKQTSRRDGA